MFPISSTALTAPQIPLVTPIGETASVNSSTVTRVGSALDAPAPASVTIDLSPVASFLLTVSQSQQQLTQLQSAIANGADPQEAARRAETLNEATQNVVNAFNLLPSVDFNQPQQQSASLLNNLVRGLTQKTAADSATQQQNLAQIGLTLQPPLLSDSTGGLSLDNEVLRAAFNSDSDRTTSTLQNTLDTFSNLATQFAEQLSAAGSAALPSLGIAQQLALTPADLAANARLDLARAEIDNLVQLPLPTSSADRLAQQRAALEQPAANLNPSTPSPIVNPLQASTAEVIAAQNAEAARATSEQLAPTSQSARTAQSAAAAAAQTDNLTQAAAAQAQAAQNAVQALSAQNAVATAAMAQARAAQARATTPEAINAAAAVVAQQVSAAQATAINLAAANAATAAASQQAVAAANAAQQAAAAQSAALPDVAAQTAAAQASGTLQATQQATLQNTAEQNAAEQASAAQLAAAQAAALAPTDPLRGNPALAAAIAAYNISDPAVLGANARAAQTTVGGIPRVAAVGAATPARGIGNAP